MPLTAPQATIDPLGAFIAGAFTRYGKRPIPLVSTSFDIQFDAGLAIVATKRVFRNDEPDSIEATITFPVPVHATLFSLEARIDGRTLKARAQRRSEARDKYEGAIERGKSAVLHEEVLRGVHMLSVAHIPPGAAIEVTAIWASTLTIVNGNGCLRVPLTVGDIYGHSRLPAADELVHGGPVQTANLTVQCAEGPVDLVGGSLIDGQAQVRLGAPIDLVITKWTCRDLRGRAADGREVILRIEPYAKTDTPLDVALLIDHSSSMGETCSHHRAGYTKHQAVTAGLTSIAERLTDSDGVDLWEFDDSPTRIGATRQSSPRQSFVTVVDRLSEPKGGTEIGRALATVIDRSTSRDILIVTDGKSYALDVHALAQMGRRIAVVLIGEDSLEANVGHLAALTGGEIFVVTGDEVADVMSTALDSLRRPRTVPAVIEGGFRRAQGSRGNALIHAEWRPSTERLDDTILARGVAAIAASVALPALSLQAATSLAASEGLVTHLTSLVLVDEAGAIQEALPATRKIALPTPYGASDLFHELFDSLDSYLSHHSPRGEMCYASKRFVRKFTSPHFDIYDVALRIDWNVSPKLLIAGDLSAIDPVFAEMLKRYAMNPAVAARAKNLNVDAVALVVALVARACGSKNRAAARIAKAILGTRNRLPEIDALAAHLGLDTPNPAGFRKLLRSARDSRRRSSQN